jgi:adenine phosphoribosyltransferase
MAIQVPFLYFIWTYIRSKSIHDLVRRLDSVYANNLHDDYDVSYLLGNLHIRQKTASVKEVLSADYNLGYFNSIFNQAHGMKFTVNNFNSNDKTWNDIHFGIKESLTEIFKNNIFQDLMVSNFPNVNGVTNLKSTLNAYFLKVWSIFTFGEIDNVVTEYDQLKNDILSVLSDNFYNSYWYRTPIIGYCYSKYMNWKNADRLDNVRERVKIMIEKSKDKKCFSTYFHESLKKRNTENIHDVLVDNVILSFLVYDFVFNYLLNATMKWINSDNKSPDTNLYSDFSSEALEESLLFPFRIRQHGNDTYILNLSSSKLFFSHGKRMCVGYSIIPKIVSSYFDCLKTCFISTDETEIKKNSNEDIPYTLSDWKVYWYDRKYFKKYLDDNKFYLEGKKTRKYDICRIYSDVNLIKSFVAYLKPYVDKFDVIISPESRGYPLAGQVSFALDKKLYLIRKERKVFGSKVTVEYSRGYDDGTEILELSSDIDIKGKKVLLIDDGIASFGTTNACIKLIKMVGGDVNLIVAPISHNYCEKIGEYAGFSDKIITFCDM